MKFDFIFMNVFFLALATTFTLLGIEASEAPGTLAQSTSTLMYLMASMNAIAVTFLDFLEIKIFLN